MADRLTSAVCLSACSFAYGINTKCASNLHYLEEQRLLYPAGQFLVSLSADDGKVCWYLGKAAANCNSWHMPARQSMLQQLALSLGHTVLLT